MVFPDQVNTAIRIIESHGKEAYAVGGCVRDSVMGTEPKDYDITTSALPTELKSYFNSFKVIETGLKHGTLTVIIDGMHLEITTYRIDGVYTDNRHPREVSFTDNLYLDLSRRDFTVNAMAFCEKTGIVDYFDGLDDLEKKQIRCVGMPDDRFNEDGLRILRALRFASVLSFGLEKNTAESIHRNYGLLKNISAERIFTELKKLICGDNCRTVLSDFRDVIAFILPELQAYQSATHNGISYYDRNLDAVCSAPSDFDIRFAALFRNCGNDPDIFDDEENALQALKRLKPDNETVRVIRYLTENRDNLCNEDIIYIKKLLKNRSFDDFFMLCELVSAENGGDPDAVKTVSVIRASAEQMRRENECLSLKQLAVRGNDISELGYSGPDIGRIMDILLDLVIAGTVNNNRVDLLNKAKEL